VFLIGCLCENTPIRVGCKTWFTSLSISGRKFRQYSWGVTIEGPLQELIEEFDFESDWIKRIEELKSMGFEIHIKEATAYAVKPGVRRKI